MFEGETIRGTTPTTHREEDRTTSALNSGGVFPRRIPPSSRSVTTMLFVCLTSTWFGTKVAYH